jgi:hypothetical protein
MAFRMEVVTRTAEYERYVFGILCISTGPDERVMWATMLWKRLPSAEVVSALFRNAEVQPCTKLS